MPGAAPQVVRPIGRRQSKRPDPHGAFLFIFPATSKEPATMAVRGYHEAWRVLDGFGQRAHVYAMDGDQLRRCRMGTAHADAYLAAKYGNTDLWWLREVEFVPFTKGPVR